MQSIHNLFLPFDRRCFSLSFWLMTNWKSAPFGVTSWIWSLDRCYPFSYVFLLPFGVTAFASSNLLYLLQRRFILRYSYYICRLHEAYQVPLKSDTMKVGVFSTPTGLWSLFNGRRSPFFLPVLLTQRISFSLAVYDEAYKDSRKVQLVHLSLARFPCALMYTLRFISCNRPICCQIRRFDWELP